MKSPEKLTASVTGGSTIHEKEWQLVGQRTYDVSRSNCILRLPSRNHEWKVITHLCVASTRVLIPVAFEARKAFAKGKSADNCPLLRDRRRARDRSSECRSQCHRHRRLSQAKVEQLRARSRQHDVAGLQVAMNDALAMGPIERVGDFHAILEHLR